MNKLFKFLVIGLLSTSLAYADIPKKVKVSENDTTAGYLNGKLVAGSNVAFMENNDGGDETLTIGLSPTNIPANSATYVTQTPDASLTAEQALSALATGLLKNTTAIGVLSIATAGVDYYASLANLQSAVSNDFHNLGGTDDDTPEASDYNSVFSSNGILTRTGASTYAARSIVSGTSKLAVTNGDGVSGNPSLSVPDLDWGDFTISSGSASIDADAVALGTDTTGNYLATLSGTSDQITVTGSGSEGATPTISFPSLIDLSFKSVVNPNSVTLPATCVTGQTYFDTDATSGRNIYGCVSANNWVLQGDGGAGETNTASNLGGGLANYDSKSGVDIRFNSFSSSDFDLTTNLYTIKDSKWAKDSELHAATTIGSDTDQFVDLVGQDIRLDTQTANTVFSAPNGVSGDPVFRQLTDNDVPDSITASSYTPTFRTITAGNGLSGGGSLAADRTISISDTLDISSNTSTAPIKKGTTPPATCSVGAYFFDTDATAGVNTYACTSANTWTLQGGSGGGGGSSIGSPVSGGTANRVLYLDGSGNLADSSEFTFIPSTSFNTVGIQNDADTSVLGSNSSNGVQLNVDNLNKKFVFQNTGDDGSVVFEADSTGAGLNKKFTFSNDVFVPKITSTDLATFNQGLILGDSADAYQFKVQGSGTSDLLVIDALNGSYSIGDSGGSNNGTFFSIADGTGASGIFNYGNNETAVIQFESSTSGSLTPRFQFNHFTSYKNTAYVSPSGNDANTGLTAVSPFLTSTKALEAINGDGEIILDGGDYVNLKFDIAGVKRVKFKGTNDERVRIYLGEQHTGSFTLHSGSVYKKVISTVIPAAVYPSTSGINPFVFETGTPEGAITQANQHPSQKSRSYRLEHYRLKQVGSIGAVTAGTYFYDSGTATLYFQRTDSANPNSTGTGIWIPSQTADQSFIYGGTGVEEIELENIEVYFGYDNFNINNVKRWVSKGLVSFGSGRGGLLSDGAGWEENWYPEYAASSSDGHPITGTNTTLLSSNNRTSFDYYPWGHDNGDQAITYHTNSMGKVTAGLIEFNLNGGIIGGGQVEVVGTYFRNNIVCGAGTTISAGTGGFGVNMSLEGITSDGDQIGVYNTGTNSRIVVSNSYITGATQAAFVANGTGIIDVYNTTLGANAGLAGGAGTTNFYASMTPAKFSIKTTHPNRGVSAFQIDASVATAAYGTPTMLLGGESSSAAASYSDINTIGFGYTDATYSYAPAEIGYKTTLGVDGTKGKIVFATRDVTTNTIPTERVNIDATGALNALGALNVTGSSTFTGVGSFNNTLNAFSNFLISNASYSDYLRIDAPLTSIFMGVNGSANGQVSCTRRFVFLTGSGFDMDFQPIAAKANFITSATEKMRIGDGGSNYLSISSTLGAVTFNTFGTNNSFIFSDSIQAPIAYFINAGAGTYIGDQAVTANEAGLYGYSGDEVIAVFNSSTGAYSYGGGAIGVDGSTGKAFVPYATTSKAKIGGVIFDHYADSTVGGAEADIYTDTLPASAFTANGDKVTASYSGNFVTVGTELTQLKVKLAGTTIWDSNALAPVTGTTSWQVNVETIRVSSTVVRYTVSLTTTGATGYNYTSVGELTGLTLSNTNILKVTGTSSGVGSGSGDIVGKMSYVTFNPAA